MAYHHRRFSLTEMFVVVAILLVMLSFLMPSLSRALESARTVTCQNHLKQLAHAAAFYMEDHQDVYPGRIDPTPSNGPWRGDGIWIAQHLAYAGYPEDPDVWDNTYSPQPHPREGGYGIFYCPSDPRANRSSSSPQDWLRINDYTLNSAFAYYPRISNPTYLVRPKLMADPHNKFFLGDGGRRAVAWHPSGWLWVNTVYWTSSGSYIGRHNGRVNLLMADFHVTLFDERDVRANWSTRMKHWQLF